MPGLGLRLDTTRLDLQYRSTYNKELPDAYERLLLDVVNGERAAPLPSHLSQICGKRGALCPHCHFFAGLQRAQGCSLHRHHAPSLPPAGDKRLFIRKDELEAAWDLYTPVLHEIDTKKVAPELYPYGSRGPVGSHYLAAKYNVRWGDLEEDML